MRNTFFLSILFLVLLFPLACTKLENKSYNSLIASEFHPSSQDLAAIVGAAYTDWRTILLQWNGLWRAQELSADELVIPARPNGWVDGGVYRRIHEHTWTPDDDIVVNTWNRTYAGINDCNRIIYQLKYNIIPVDDSTKKSLIAEMRALRASYYWVLCDFFGNVPIIDSFNVPSGFLPKQSSRLEVYNYIINELIDNIPLLTTEVSQKTYGRFTQWAARVLLAKMYLNAQIYSGNPEWDKCIAQCDTIINSGLFQLESNHKNVFATHNEGSKEIIFALPFDHKYTTGWNDFDLHMETLEPENQRTYNLLYPPWGGICVDPQFVNTFDTNDLRYQYDFIKGQQFASNGDSLFCTLGTIVGQPLRYVNSLPGVDSSQEIHGFRLGKFEIAMGSTNVLDNDFPLFRYADVLMMKAECLLRTGHPNEAAAIVTQVRSRDFNNPSEAYVSGLDLMQGSSYSYGLRNHLDSTYQGGSDIQYGRFLDELGWEFMQEGRRRTDLIRFGVFTKKSWLSHSPNGDYRALFPIPRAEIAKNPNLTQNPGY
ncbi:MAG: RagB/SusD family nutrient uptake outer membrane protein [Acidobacterium ailaaui]|nr:RagB/SusD family nutrient uptake outer membrane protein [Pseudacidobacterium ailaaui]